MKTLGFLVVTLLTYNASANDGGVYYIDAKLKRPAPSEAQDSTFGEVLVTIKGKEADLLRRSLPKTISVDKMTERNSSTLAVTDKDSGALLMINCTNLSYDENYKVIKMDETECTISYEKYGEADKELVYDTLGDARKMRAPMCK